MIKKTYLLDTCRDDHHFMELKTLAIWLFRGSMFCYGLGYQIGLRLCSSHEYRIMCCWNKQRKAVTLFVSVCYAGFWPMILPSSKILFRTRFQAFRWKYNLIPNFCVALQKRLVAVGCRNEGAIFKWISTIWWDLCTSDRQFLSLLYSKNRAFS